MIQPGFCHCGCGGRTSISTSTSAKAGRVKGQPCRFISGHTSRCRPQANTYVQVRVPEVTHRWVLEHVVIAERVLGRPLPAGAQVHHVDENRKNNAHGNLVICQDQKYHQLLHVRARVLRAGGNPNTDAICSKCQQVKPLTEFSVRSDSGRGHQAACKPCAAIYWRDRAAQKKAEREARRKAA